VNIIIIQTVAERMKDCKTIAERIQNGVKTPGDYMEYLTCCAKEWIPGSLADINRNKHMNNCGGRLGINQMNQDLVDATITAFLNHVGASFCMDYGLYANDLKYERKSLETYGYGDDPWIR
jgi:hypothetical protein